MEKFEFTDNTKDVFVPINPINPQMAFLPKEESTMWSLQEYNYDGINDISSTRSINGIEDIVQTPYFPFNPESGLPTSPLSSSLSQTDYIGSIVKNVPHIINPTFTDFLLIKANNDTINTIASQAGSTIESWVEQLFLVEEAQKVITLFNGLQVVKIPADRLNNTTTNPIIKNYSTYYLKISPKCIDAEVTGITSRQHVLYKDIEDLYNSQTGGRREIVKVNKNDFRNSIWNFEDANYNKQRGRLFGSIIEIWNSGLTEKKQTKIAAETSLEFFTDGADSNFVLSPDYMGYDAPGQVITPGDILRIYPRETYFTPIIIELNYKDPATDLTSLIQFMKNDVARDLVSGIYEIYSNAGITFDAEGNINGEVIQSFQIFQKGLKEIRKKI